MTLVNVALVMSSSLARSAGPAGFKSKFLERYALRQTKLIEPLSSQASRFQDSDSVIVG